MNHIIEPHNLIIKNKINFSLKNATTLKTQFLASTNQNGNSQDLIELKSLIELISQFQVELRHTVAVTETKFT